MAVGSGEFVHVVSEFGDGSFSFGLVGGRYILGFFQSFINFTQFAVAFTSLLCPYTIIHVGNSAFYITVFSLSKEKRKGNAFSIFFYDHHLHTLKC